MTGNELLRRQRRLGQQRGVEVRLDELKGKGSHAALYYGSRRTTLKDRRKEIGPGSVAVDASATGPYSARFRIRKGMTRTPYSYPTRLEPDEEGRLVVRFPDLPEALTDGADVAEALAEASDCPSAALAARIVNDEAIPAPSRLRPEQYLVAPEATMALKSALHSALRARKISINCLARRLNIDDRRAARLIDPRAASRLADLEAALSVLGYTIAIETIAIEVLEKPAA